MDKASFDYIKRLTETYNFPHNVLLIGNNFDEPGTKVSYKKAYELSKQIHASFIQISLRNGTFLMQLLQKMYDIARGRNDITSKASKYLPYVTRTVNKILDYNDDHRNWKSGDVKFYFGEKYATSDTMFTSLILSKSNIAAISNFGIQNWNLRSAKLVSEHEFVNITNIIPHRNKLYFISNRKLWSWGYDGKTYSIECSSDINYITKLIKDILVATTTEGEIIICNISENLEFVQKRKLVDCKIVSIIGSYLANHYIIATANGDIIDIEIEMEYYEVLSQTLLLTVGFPISELTLLNENLTIHAEEPSISQCYDMNIKIVTGVSLQTENVAIESAEELAIMLERLLKLKMFIDLKIIKQGGIASVIEP
eukprot:TRINITY_DN6952_c0_g1_i1.p1 TRINITY_DN6952_c0_g1~~TRINITY_DN6952_c0_g1_i1.p1  ORF type:complete len:368 (-),score=64.20 TRINITY_DN6952_c0_g1_i1:38-1141(-)